MSEVAKRRRGGQTGRFIVGRRAGVPDPVSSRPRRVDKQRDVVRIAGQAVGALVRAFRRHTPFSARGSGGSVGETFGLTRTSRY